MSPYNVQYPNANSVLLPVESTIHPNLLDNAIKISPLIRACIFSSATLGLCPEKHDLNVCSISSTHF